MDCKEFERLIPEFMEDRLDYKRLKKFMEHADGCGECSEELAIQFLVTEGMVRLEKGGTFDLQREMMLRMEEARRSMRMHNTVKYISITLGLFAVAALAVIIWLVI